MLQFLLKAGDVARRTFTSAPVLKDVHGSLSKLYAESVDKAGEKSGSMFNFDMHTQSIIIFSDQHKGARDGSDDFAAAEKITLQPSNIIMRRTSIL